MNQQLSQRDVDWSSRLQQARLEPVKNADQVIVELRLARDDLQAALDERDRQLTHQRALLESLRVERDRAVGLIQERGLAMHDVHVDGAHLTEQLDSLHTENSALREIIGEMRQQMELVPGGTTDNFQDDLAELKSQLSQLRSQGPNQQLTEQLRLQQRRILQLEEAIMQAGDGGKKSHARYILQLQNKLEKYTARLKEVTADRDRLEDLCDRLRSSAKRAPAQPQPGSSRFSDIEKTQYAIEHPKQGVITQAGVKPIRNINSIYKYCFTFKTELGVGE